MKEVLVSINTFSSHSVYPISYYRLENGKHYGVCIRDHHGNCTTVKDITTKQSSIDQLLRLLVRGSVTPTSLHDVIEDWLAI